jgi:2-polyprenyl-3-methyl-5-hydroxy-6-metoxy-1,4-benzoquinol methylase
MTFARMGAQATGIDFSEKAIEKATEFSKQLNLDTTFICCDIYEAPKYLKDQFDIVFTSYGTIGWLPDLDKWATVVSQFL